MWEGVPLLARLPALNPAVGFLFQPLAWPVDFRSSAPHHNPPFLELATTSSPCQAMELCDRALNLGLPSEPMLNADPRWSLLNLTLESHQLMMISLMDLRLPFGDATGTSFCVVLSTSDCRVIAHTHAPRTAQQFSGNRVGYGDARHTVSWLSELSSVILRRVQRAWVSSSSAPL